MIFKLKAIQKRYNSKKNYNFSKNAIITSKLVLTDVDLDVFNIDDVFVGMSYSCGNSL